MQAACWGVLLAACGLPAAGRRAAPVGIATGTAGLHLWLDASQPSSLFTGTNGTGAIGSGSVVA